MRRCAAEVNLSWVRARRGRSDGLWLALLPELAWVGCCGCARVLWRTGARQPLYLARGALRRA